MVRSVRECVRACACASTPLRGREGEGLGREKSETLSHSQGKQSEYQDFLFLITTKGLCIKLAGCLTTHCYIWGTDLPGQMEREVADQTCCLTQSQHTDTGTARPSTDPTTQGVR